eukprot:3398548-Rhodomonas_salina.1
MPRGQFIDPVQPTSSTSSHGLLDCSPSSSNTPIKGVVGQRGGFARMKRLVSCLLLCVWFSPRTDAYIQMGSFVSNARCAPSLCSKPLLGATQCARTGSDARNGLLSLRLSAAGPGTQDLEDETTFAPVPVMNPADEQTEAFKVVPPDCSSASATDVVVKPGLGWGDGKHPSTSADGNRSQFVWEHVSARENPSFLDYGTGSGVLAICAKKFGAGKVLGIDKDDEILEHAQDNCLVNNVEEVDLLNGRELMPGSSGLYIGTDFTPTTFDVVCANMLPAALVKLAAFISLGVKDDTGILTRPGSNVHLPMPTCWKSPVLTSPVVSPGGGCEGGVCEAWDQVRRREEEGGRIARSKVDRVRAADWAKAQDDRGRARGRPHLRKSQFKQPIFDRILAPFVGMPLLASPPPTLRPCPSPTVLTRDRHPPAEPQPPSQTAASAQAATTRRPTWCPPSSRESASTAFPAGEPGLSVAA